MVDDAFDQPEDRALEQQRRDQLGPGDLAILCLGRVLFVEDRPESLEALLGEEAGDQSGDDSDWGKKHLHAGELTRGAMATNCAYREPMSVSPLPDFGEPMKAKLTERRFSDPGWLFERKLDGVRAIAIKSGGEVRLISRTGRLLVAYPELAEALAADAAEEFVVDGEIVAFEGAQTSFSRLQGRMQIQDPEQARRTGIPVFLYLFDLLYFDGHDLRQLPLRQRKSLLRRALAFADPIRYTSHRNERGEEYYREACAKGWEGLIAKRAESPYTSRRSGDWLKFKCSREQELVIGASPRRRARASASALCSSATTRMAICATRARSGPGLASGCSRIWVRSSSA